MRDALFPDLVVNGTHVPQAAIAAEAQNHAAPRGKPGVSWRKAANALAIRTLLLQEARRRGIEPTPRELAPRRVETDDEALIRELLEMAIEPHPPTEAELRAEWARDPQRFQTPSLWEVSHILCACDPRDHKACESARARAAALTCQVLRDGSAFASLARRESDCASRSNGGMLGQIGPGDSVSEFEAALRALGEGDTTWEPVLTRHGYHIIRLDAAAKRQTLPFQAVRPRIAEAIEKARWARAAHQYIQDLVQSATISGAEIGPVDQP